MHYPYLTLILLTFLAVPARGADFPSTRDAGTEQTTSADRIRSRIPGGAVDQPGRRPEGRQRPRLLRNLFSPQASNAPLARHFSLVIPPENVNPPYNANRLALVCLTDGAYGSGGCSTLDWRNGAKPDGAVFTTED